jgi:hypothetical protein
VRLGAFALTDINISISATPVSASIPGTSIDFVDVLGGDRTLTVFRADASWRFWRGNGIDFSWYDIDMRGRRTINAEIRFGDRVYPINSTIDSRVRTNIYKFDYSYTFRRDKPHQFSALIGAHIMRVQTSLSASGSMFQSEESFSATAPLPSFGLGWKARWTDRFSSQVIVQYFGISLEEDKYSGHFVDFLAAAQYRFSQRFGIGAGYNLFKLNAQFKGKRLILDFDQGYNGLLTYLFAEF